MAYRRLQLTRRAALLGAGAWVAGPRAAPGFGQAEAFHARALQAGGEQLTGVRESAPARWAWELVRRTSAPGRLVSSVIEADEPELLDEPFCVWSGSRSFSTLGAPERRGIERFIKLGGVMVVDDADPGKGDFGRAARREMAAIFPESPLIQLPASHVIYKTYYIVDRPVGRFKGTPHVEAIVRGNNAQVIFLAHDLLGALARTPSGSWAYEVVPGGFRQREMAIRLAVNLAMYVLCSDYKDDQVHAPWLMRRRARRRP